MGSLQHEFRYEIYRIDECMITFSFAGVVGPSCPPSPWLMSVTTCSIMICCSYIWNWSLSARYCSVSCLLCSVWSSQRRWWHSRCWHTQLHKGWESDTWQAGGMLSLGGHLRLGTWSWWLRHGQLLHSFILHFVLLSEMLGLVTCFVVCMWYCPYITSNIAQKLS